MSRPRLSVVLCAAALCWTVPAAAQYADPPGRVGRVSAVSGAVSLMPMGASDWSVASLNYPLTTGDALWVDSDARAEFHLGSSALQLGPMTSMSFDAISDFQTQLRMGQGSVHVRVRSLAQDENFEIDTPAGVILLRLAGNYRIDVTPDGRRSTITVRDGGADLIVGNDTRSVRSGFSATLTGSSDAPFAIGPAFARDDWEVWAESRNRREDAVASTRYVSRDMVGYEDLDEYGDWRNDPRNGPMWYPRNVPAGWAPYRSGHWESIAPWGWTWIDDTPWGFAPSHYGRWAYASGRWGWMPGAMHARPVYAPALVAFISGDNWDVSLRFGSGGGVGWVPLGPGEPFVPAYRTSPTYVRNVNVTYVTNVNVINVNVNNVRYVNRDVPGAVTAVPRAAFEGSRPVAQVAVVVRAPDLTRARPSAAPVAAGAVIAERRAPPPDRGRGANAEPVRRPPTPIPTAPRALPRQVNAPALTAPAPIQRAPATAPTPPPTPAAGRGRGQSPQPNPVGAQTPVPPAPPIPTPPPSRGGPPQRRDSVRQAPRVSVVPPAPAPAPAPAPGRGRGQQAPQAQATNAAQQYRDELARLAALHQKEAADLARQHEQQTAARGAAPDVAQQQAAERKALADKQQRQRDSLDKRFKKKP
jgi:hypothetical protein